MLPDLAPDERFGRCASRAFERESETLAAGPLANPAIAPMADGDRRRRDLSQIAAQRGAFEGMRADSTSRPTDGQTIVGVRSGTLLDPELVAELRAVAVRTDIAQRVLTILEPGQGPTSPTPAGQRGR